MNRAKNLAAALAAVMLLVVAGCQAEPETTTLATTKTAQTPTTTVTTTVAAPAVTQTETVLQTTTVTQTITTSPAATTTTEPTTTTTTGGFEPVTSADGKLQIVETQYQHPYTSDNLVTGVVENLSDETLYARITAEFLTATGTVAQTKWTIVQNIAPGEQKNFTVKADLYIGEYAGFNVYVEVEP